MIFELCRETGWTVEYILKMPARRFFILRKTMFELQREERFTHLMDLCDVQFISVAQNGYQQELKDYYKKHIEPESSSKKMLNSRQFDSDNETDRQKVDDILKSTFKQKAKLMGLQ